MKLRCKPGDMAILIGDSHPLFLGRCVEVVEYHPEEQKGNKKGFWLVTADWIPHSMNQGFSSDHNLLPITPPPNMKETEKDKELDLVQ